jgi:DNA modification methylase
MKMSIKILQGNCLETLSSLEEKSVNTCVTSPPYWGLRDYGNGDQLGQEETPEKFTENLVKLFREVRRVLRDDGTVWLNLGDSYHRVRRSRHQSLINHECQRSLVLIKDMAWGHRQLKLTAFKT